MKFADFAIYLSELERTPSRLAMTEILAKLFRQLDSGEIRPACYLLEGQLVPQYLSLEFQLSVKMVLRAFAKIESKKPGQAAENVSLFGESDLSQVENKIQTRYKELGDVGALAEELLATNTSAALSLSQVYDHLVTIAKEGGAGSQERKLLGLVELLDQLEASAAKYVCRMIIGRLRLGFSTMTMLDALSWAQTGSKVETAQLEEAFQRKADLGKLAETYLAAKTDTERATVLKNYQAETGVPIVPQLCQRLNDPQEVIEKMKEVIVEPKYDGLRVQIHLNKNSKGQTEVMAFTRNLENVSHMFPELSQLQDVLNAESVILDAEAIGYDPATSKLLPFQATITRRRKHQVEQTAKSVPLKFFIFDVISVNGESLIDKKLQQRKDVLIKLIKQNETFIVTQYIITSDPKELQNFHESQLGDGLEGVVIKQVAAPYQSGRKNWYWVKMKEKTGTQGKLTDTLDCVVMGYYFGRGKRTAFGIGAFLAGVLDGDTFKTLAKIGTGLSDDQFKELKRRSDLVAVTKPPKEYKVAKGLIPDVWLAPEILVEVAADELTKSPQHSAGLALRFPRLVKFRDDKSWQEATTLQEIITMAGQQNQ